MSAELAETHLEPEAWLTSATCLRVEDGYAFFESPKASAINRFFHATTKALQSVFGESGPAEGQCYELVVRYHARADWTPPIVPRSAMADILSAKEISKPDIPYMKWRRVKPLENKEYVLTAECLCAKGNATIFRTPLRGFPRPRFAAETSSFPKSDERVGPEPGKWYILTMRFYTTKGPAGHQPRVDITNAKMSCPSASHEFSCRTLSAAEQDQAILASFATTMIATYTLEYTLSAQVQAIKGHAMFFECPSSGFQPSCFAANMKSLYFAPTPSVGEWFELEVVFSKDSRRLKWPHGKVKRATRIPEPTEVYAIRKNDSHSGNENDRLESSDASNHSQGSSAFRREYVGVICYDDGSLQYVYSSRLGCEALVRGGRNMKAGHWIEFNAILDNNNELCASDTKRIEPRFPTIPLCRSVLVECEITVVINLVDDSVGDQVDTNFVRGVRDVHGLLQDVTPGTYAATIKYVYEGCAPSGFWQLEYIL